MSLFEIDDRDHEPLRMAVRKQLENCRIDYDGVIVAIVF